MIQRICRKRRGCTEAPASHILTVNFGDDLMNNLEDRKNAFENKFVHDADMQFKVGARRNKLLGLWVADLLGKTSEEASIYATEVVKSDFEEAGDEDVYRKVSGDLGELADEATVRAKMAQFLTEAKSQLMSEID